MGTYAVTHIKNNNKIIPLSDSYDGYLSGMGLANLLSIKFISTEKLKELFDSYTALPALNKGDEFNEEEENEPTSVSQRIIDDASYSLAADCKNDPEVIQWFNRSLSDSIRTSTSGFGPLLYINHAPHYGRDYDYCDYLVDLDKEEFSNGGYTISFADIRKISTNHLTYFTNGDLSLQKIHYPSFFNNEEYFDDLYPEYYDESVALTTEQLEKRHLQIERINQHVQHTLNLPQEAIDSYYQEKEAEEKAYFLKYEEEQKTKQLVENKGDTSEEYGAYSIHNLQNIEPVKLRLILTFLQNLIKEKPEAAFLLRNADWGLSEDFKESGIRFFSPMTSDLAAHEIFDSVINVIEYKFKIPMNIFSSTGRWSFDVKETEDNLFGLGFGDKPGPENCIYTLDDVKDFENSEELIEYLHPFLGYHMNYPELRPLLLENKTAETASFYMYFALLNRDIEVVEALYDASKKDLLQAEKSDIKRVFNNYLQSISDSSLIKTCVAEINKTSVSDDGFIESLKASRLVQDLIPYMNKQEKKTFNIP